MYFNNSTFLISFFFFDFYMCAKNFLFSVVGLSLNMLVKLLIRRKCKGVGEGHHFWFFERTVFLNNRNIVKFRSNILTFRYGKDPKHIHHYLMALKNGAVIDATQRGNISRFINHSCDPNCESQKVFFLNSVFQLLPIFLF